jgi:ABC-2 type transport system permease protein
MNLLRAERIKLLSTRTSWWCTAIAVFASLGFTIAVLGLNGEQTDTTVGDTQTASSFGRTVLLVLAVLSATSEFNWGTMRVTFQAVPSRTPALLAKAVVVAVWCGFAGLVIGFGSWGLGLLLKPDVDLSLSTAADWRVVAGQGLTFGFTAILGVGVGLLVRSTAAAITGVLIWTQAVEGLVVLIPKIGHHVYTWMPFFAAQQFAGGSLITSTFNLGALPLSPLGYGAYFAAISVVIYGAGLLVTRRRDA